MTPLYFAQRSADAYDSFTFRSAGTEVLICVEDWGHVVAFRGTTSDFIDILRDLRAIPWHDRDLGWCHSGFLKGARSIWPMIRPAIKGKGPVWFTGHSLGGALATLCAAMMVLDGGPPEGLVTFGCPRVGFSLESRLRPIRVQERWIHGIDCVPSHPWPLWGYRHTSIEGLIPLIDGDESDRFLNHRIADYISALT